MTRPGWVNRPYDGQLSPLAVAGPRLTGWDLVAWLAQRQHGVVTFDQLLVAELSPDAIDGACKRCRLIRLHRGVFAVGHRRETRESAWIGAVLACGPLGVLSHLPAAALTNLWRRDLPMLPIDVSIGSRSHVRRPAIRIHRPTELRQDEVIKRKLIPCTSIARTVIDCAAQLRIGQLEHLLEAAEDQGAEHLRAVRATLSKRTNLSGSADLRRLLADRAPINKPTKRELERRMCRLCQREALPDPAVNVWIDTPSQRLQVDFVWAERCLVVETDSRKFHDTHTRAEHDKHRDALLALAGWRVQRFTWKQVVLEPDLVTRVIRKLLGLTGLG